METLIALGLLYFFFNQDDGVDVPEVSVISPPVRPSTFRADPALLEKLRKLYGSGQLFGSNIGGQFYWVNYPNMPPAIRNIYQMNFNYLSDLAKSPDSLTERPEDIQPKGRVADGFWVKCPPGFPGGKEWCHRDENGFYV